VTRGYRVMRLLVHILYLLQARLRVYHAERVPREGPVLLVGNHLGLTDQFAVGLGLRRQLRIMTKREVFEWPLIGGLARLAGLISVRRGASDRAALELLVGLLRDGRCVLVFPEGTFLRAPAAAAMASFKTGAAWLALRTGAPVVPVALQGSERIWAPRHGWRWWHRPRVSVTFGEPYIPEMPRGVSMKVALRAVSDEMGYRVAALLPEAYRGGYARERLPGEHIADGEIVSQA
jgi:1-acyl-sn-glycerol-3-phosphate acyltransferase